MFYTRKLRSLLYKNAPRGSHCGGKENCRFCGPPQAENPAKQDSLFYTRKLRSLLYKNAPRGSHCGRKENAAFAACRRRRILRSRILSCFRRESCKAGFCFIGNSSEPVKERYFAQKQSACRDRGCGGKDPLSAGTENRRNRDAAEKKKKTEYERGDNHG